jgi:alpha-acetolactate decarboxylase
MAADLGGVSMLKAIMCGLMLCASADAATRAPEVRSFGAFREIIHEGRFEGRTRLATAMSRPHGYALGALAGLDGEFIVLDGKAYLSRPDHKGSVVNSMSASGADSAALLVYSNIKAWRDVRVTRPIALSALPDTVMARGKALGLPAGGAFPFLVEGPVSHVQWHVADGSKLPRGPSTHEEHAKASAHGERNHVTATLLGFYSDHDMGNWLHHDSNVHVHALLPGGLAAHLDDVTLEPGAVLRLPSAW